MYIQEMIHTSHSVQKSDQPYGRMLLPLRSSFKVNAGGSVYEMTDGMVLLLSPGEFCVLEEKGSPRLLQILFTPTEEMPHGAFLLSEQEEMMLDTLLATDTADARLQPLAEYLILCCSAKEPIAPLTIAKDAALFADAAALLKERVSSQIKVDALAEEMGISLSHLKRIFARYAGKGAHDYFNDLKIEYAKELLAAGHSVTQTAALTGFANQAYFSAAFKRITGQNPKEFCSSKRHSLPVAAAPKRSTTKPRKKPSPKPAAPAASQRRQDLPSYLL